MVEDEGDKVMSVLLLRKEGEDDEGLKGRDGGKGRKVSRRAYTKIIGRKRFNIGGRKGKEWWDEEVKLAMSNKKTENRKQRKLTTLKKKHGGMDEAEWREAWDR